MLWNASQRLLCSASVLLVSLVLSVGCVSVAQAAEELARPLSKQEVFALLKGYVSPAIVADIVQGRGVGFKLDPQTEKELRAADATDQLLKAIQEHFIAPNRQGGPILSVVSTPGDAHVYVDDKPMGVTSSQGKLEVATLSAGVHWVRVSHQGYEDYEQPVALDNGETTRLSVKLEATQASPSEAEPSKPAANASKE